MGVFDSLLGLGSTMATNQANREIAQMNNEFNAKEAQKTRDFQLEMFNRTNEYNSPKAQSERYYEAGLNPALANGLGSVGIAQSPQGSPAASASGNPRMQAWTPNFSDIPNAILSVAQARNMNSKTEFQDILNGFQRDRSLAEINKILGDTNHANSTPEARKFFRDMSMQISAIRMSQLEQEWLNQSWTGNLLKAQTVSQYLSAEAQSTINKYLDNNQQLDLKVKAANYSNLIEQGRMTRQKTQQLLADTILTYARAKGVRIQNSIADKTAESLVDSMINQNTYNSKYFRARGYGNNPKNEAKLDFYEKRAKSSIWNKEDASYGLRNSIEYGSKLFNGVGNYLGRPSVIYRDR